MMAEGSEANSVTVTDPSPDLSTEDTAFLADPILAEFKRLTIEALTHDGSRGILAGIVGELVEILGLAAEFQVDSHLDITEGETPSAEGLAISPTQAAMCAEEPQRTAMFLRGLHEAIASVIETKSPHPVRVLYAGSGPFAALAVPLMTLFPPELVRFTILDIHPVSIKHVKSVVRRLGLADRVDAYVVADACEYTIPRDSVPDIILSETMSTALETEPQVAIMRHLLSQVPEAILVPESVRVDAYLVDTSDEVRVIVPESEGSADKSQPDRISLGPVFELNAATIRSWASLSGDSLPAATIDIPPPPTPLYRPYLFTTITTYGKHRLRTHDCNLTGIREIAGSEEFSDGGSMQFSYRLGGCPGLVGEGR